MSEGGEQPPAEDRLARMEAMLAMLVGARAARAGDDRRVTVARRALAMRQAAQRHLPGPIADGPGQAILIDLYVSTAEARSVAVHDACVASGAPMSTALRWIASLADAGLVAKTPDPADGRRTLLALTPAGRAGVEALLDAWATLTD